MITDKEILDYWKNSLVRIPAESFEGKNIHQETQIFLQDIGLPSRKVLLMNFETKHNLLEVFLHHDTKYFVLGDDYGTQICLKEDGGEIFSIDDRGEYPTRFINSNVRSLVIFLQQYDAAQQILPSKETDDSIIQNLKQKFLDLDPKALSNSENWWAVILEQVSDGLI